MNFNIENFKLTMRPEYTFFYVNGTDVTCKMSYYLNVPDAYLELHGPIYGTVVATAHCHEDDVFNLEVAVKLHCNHQEHGNEHVGNYYRKNVAEDAHIEENKEYNIEADIKSRVDYSLQCIHFRVSKASDVIRNGALKICRDDKHYDQPVISVKIVEEPKKRRQDKEDSASEEQHSHSRGKDLLFLILRVYCKTENSVVHTYCGKRHQKVRRLRNQVYR